MSQKSYLEAFFSKTYYNRKMELCSKNYDRLNFTNHAGITMAPSLQIVFCDAIYIKKRPYQWGYQILVVGVVCYNPSFKTRAQDGMGWHLQ